MAHNCKGCGDSESGLSARVGQVRENSWKRWELKCEWRLLNRAFQKDGRFLPWNSMKRDSEVKRKKAWTRIRKPQLLIFNSSFGLQNNLDFCREEGLLNDFNPGSEG